MQKPKKLKYISITLFLLMTVLMFFLLSKTLNAYTRSEGINEKIDVYYQYESIGKDFADVITFLNNNLDKKYDLYFKNTVTLTASSTVPTNAIKLIFDRSGIITGNYTLTFTDNIIESAETKIFGDLTAVSGNVLNPINVKWFAYGDGTTDDTTLIQRALTWMKLNDDTNLIFPKRVYATTGTLTIDTNSGYKHKIFGNYSEIKSTSTTVVLDIGSNWNNCYISDFYIDSSTAHTLMKLSGTQINTSTFENFYLYGDASGTTTVHGLLVFGPRNYYNRFNNFEIAQAQYCLSIGYDHQAGVGSTFATLPNANKFTNLDVLNYDNVGIYLYSTVGNQFINFDCHENIAGATDHLALVSPVSTQNCKSNYFVGRIEGSATDDIDVGEHAVNNYFGIMVDVTINWYSSTEQRENMFMKVGGFSEFYTQRVTASTFRGMPGSDTALQDNTSTYKMSLNNSGAFYPQNNDGQDLGIDSTNEFRDLHLSSTANIGNLSVSGNVVSHLVANGPDKDFAAHVTANQGIQFVGADKTIVLADTEEMTFQTRSGGIFIVQNVTSGYNGVFHADFTPTTITAISDPTTQFDVTDVDNNKIAIFKSGSTPTVSVKNYTGSNATIIVFSLGQLATGSAPF